MLTAQKQLKLSIITINYNDASGLEKTIQSIKSQDYPNIEYIIIDGNSTDQTHSVIEKNQSIISKFISETDKGIYDAMNKGLTFATGDYVGFLNSGDVFSHNSIVSNLATTLSKTKIDGLYGDLAFCNKKLKITRYWKAGNFNKNKMRYGWMPPHLTFYLKRCLYQRHGFYNTKFETAADYELMLRMIYKYNCSMIYHPECMIIMDNGGISSRSISHRLNANKMDRLAWDFNYIKPNYLFRLLKPLRKLGQYCFLNYNIKNNLN